MVSENFNRVPPYHFSAIAAQIIIYFLFNFELIVLTTGAVLTTGTPVHRRFLKFGDPGTESYTKKKTFF